MPFQPTVLGQLVQSISRTAFRGACAGRAKWALSDWAHLMVLVVAQVSGVASLRDLTRLLAHHRCALSHLGIGAVSRSTLADANRTRASTPFAAVAAQLSAMVAQLAPGLAREALRLIDATSIHAGKTVQHWAVGGGIKLHVVFDPILRRTTFFCVTPARTNDISVAHRMPIEVGATYVFDLGYYAFTFWARLDAEGCRFVTRLKTNTLLRTLVTNAVPEDAPHILSDRIGRLPARLAANRRNPYSAPVRMIEVRISTGRVLRLVSNDLDAPAADIAALYKARWEIELFFKWLKQNLKLRHFLGSGRNAVTLQVLAALIAFLLVRIAQLRAASALPGQAAFRLIGAAAMQRRNLLALLHHPPPSPTPPSAPQLALALA
jgi:hypothetical protein